MNAKQSKQICRNEASGVCARCGLATCLCLGNCRFSQFSTVFHCFSFSFTFTIIRRKSFRPTWQVDLYSWIARDLLSFSLNKKVRHNLWHNVGHVAVAATTTTTSCLTQFWYTCTYLLARGLRKLWLQLERIFCIHRLHLSVGSPIDRNAKSDNCSSRYLV